MITTVTEEGIAALLNLGDRLEQETEKVHQECAKLESVFEENQAGLGPHSEKIRALLEEVGEAESDAAAPVKKLVLRLNRAAAIRTRILNSTLYSTGKGRSR